MPTAATEVVDLPRTARHARPTRGHPINGVRLKYEMGRRGLNTLTLAKRSGVSRWCISRAMGGHPIDFSSLQKISKAFTETPVIDGGLLATPEQLEGS